MDGLPRIKELANKPPGLEYARLFSLGRCRILVAHEGPIGWHLSISHPTRYPTWDEICKARYELLPDDVTMAQILPPKSEYVNVHPNCFHLHEIRGEMLPPSWERGIIRAR